MKCSPLKPDAPNLQVRIEGSLVHVVTPEGQDVSMPLRELFETVGGRANLNHWKVLPDGVLMVIPRGRFTLLVHQSDPCVRRLKWIAADSPAPYGPEATYREVRIALPYVIVMAVFGPGRGGLVSLSERNEAFFRNRPLAGPEDELFYPALLNCSKFDPQDGHPLSWICTQYLKRSFDRERDENKRWRLGLKGLLSCLYETGFNYSSEHNEHSSWFSESRTVDPRVSSIEAWEEATIADRFFPLEVPWLPTGFTLGEVAERIFAIHRAAPDLPDSATALARVVLNHAAAPDRTRPAALLEDSKIPF